MEVTISVAANMPPNTAKPIETRLIEDERYQIYEGMTEKRSHREITTPINKHHYTASKEVKVTRWFALPLFMTIPNNTRLQGGDLYKYLHHEKPIQDAQGPQALEARLLRVSIIYR